MPLQASGQISLGNIADELGSAKSNLSLGDSITTAELNGTNPDQMSDFYSYANSKQYNAQTAAAHGIFYECGTTDNYALPTPASDFSCSVWCKPRLSTKANFYQCDFRPNSGSDATSRFILVYVASTNALYARYQSTGGNFEARCALHDATTNAELTGVEVSATGWCTSQVGNVNSDGFAHLACTYDGSQTLAAAAFKIYWNGAELDITASTNASRSPFAPGLGYGASGNSADDNLGTSGDHDMFSAFTSVLTGENITKLYNNGIPVSDAQHGIGNILLESRIETTVTVDTSLNGDWSIASNGGTITAY